MEVIGQKHEIESDKNDFMNKTKNIRPRKE